MRVTEYEIEQIVAGYFGIDQDEVALQKPPEGEAYIDIHHETLKEGNR